MANLQVDIQKFSDAAVKLSVFGAQRLAKANEQQTLSATLATIKTAITALNGEGTITKDQLATAIFQILSAGADLSKSLYVQDLENLANQLYLIITGGGGNFATVWSDIQNLYNGKLKGLPSAEPNIAADAQALETGLITVLGYVLQNLKLAGSTEDDIKSVLAGITSGIDAFDTTVEITTDIAVGAVYEVLEGIADLTGSATPLAIEQLLKKIYAIVEGDQSNFIKFFQSIGLSIEAHKLAKQAQKEAK